ncbi:MAG: signal recognition particle-docking protein FtsY [Candidatus Goldbacteria bacterium]|nr:signal recognition particle-docking protein FtsY [Candidatus Goldiibacteriota bacterium]
MDRTVIKKSISFLDKIKNFFSSADFTEIESLEQVLLEADIDVAIVDSLMENLKNKKINNYNDAAEFLKKYFISELSDTDTYDNFLTSFSVIMLVGINGSGKTTTAAKLAYFFKKSGKKILFIAGDTFRAAATQQLEIWAEKTGVEIIKGREGADPSSVIFDGLSHAKKGNYDLIIIDTAGRVHTKQNLMAEIEKIKRTVLKFIDEKNLFCFLVIDANTGKNSFNQAKMFNEVLKLKGLILTKMDSNSKAGSIVKIKKELGLPVRFITFGEKPEDIEKFNAKDFVERLFE